LIIRDSIPDTSAFVIDSNELSYFENHKYTSGFGTYFKDFYKLPPAISVSNLSQNNLLQVNIYFEELSKLNRDKRDYEATLESHLKQNIRNIDTDLPTFLFFSGGIDSSLLYFLTKQELSDFKLVFVKYLPADSDNYYDEKMVDLFASQQNVEIVKIVYDSRTIDEESTSNLFLQSPFDLMYPAIPFALRELESLYGKCNVITGQSADSIFCWGSSSESLSAGLQRFITSGFYLGLPSQIRFIISCFYTILYKFIWSLNREWYVPYKQKEYYAGLLSPQGYLPIVRGRSYYEEFLSFITERINQEIEVKDYRIMYYKLMYLQGTSNILWVKHCSINGHNLHMPFLSARIVDLVIKEQAKFKTIFRPRYELKFILGKYFDLIGFRRVKNNVKKIQFEGAGFRNEYSKHINLWKSLITRNNDG
jgi:asparagine synthetase B (glutamine-hydrolysing)